MTSLKRKRSRQLDLDGQHGHQIGPGSSQKIGPRSSQRVRHGHRRSTRSTKRTWTVNTVNKSDLGPVNKSDLDLVNRSDTDLGGHGQQNGPGWSTRSTNRAWVWSTQIGPGSSQNGPNLDPGG